MKKLVFSFAFAMFFVLGSTAQTSPAPKPKTSPVPATTTQPAGTTKSGSATTQQPTTAPSKKGSGLTKANVRTKPAIKPVSRVPKTVQQAPAAK